MTGFFLLLGFVIAQRLAELILARRNEEWMRGRGAVEAGREHYVFAVLLHTMFLVSMTVEVVALRKQAAWWWWIPFVFFMLAEGLRYWCIRSLGKFWNTRILVLPGAKLVRRGPYRFSRHPNYVAVATEILCLPLIFKAYFTAAVFSILNAAFLSVRIPAEERALKQAYLSNETIADKGVT